MVKLQDSVASCTTEAEFFFGVQVNNDISQKCFSSANPSAESL